ncbi:hypothetical protein ACEQPO_07850 [Bacillus sp. SL00103]
MEKAQQFGVSWKLTYWREVQAFDPSFVKLVPLDELEQYDRALRD